ncbi:uncharacterized protein [Lolium perenne]|uniref:uncharacterized protein n=1 Tax=Lolium perenne TaxID=4522 RepID=UPI0021F52CBD|nr:uncharacterized protein LOC127294924 [Lolium perenne]
MQSVCPTATAAARPPLRVVPRALAPGMAGRQAGLHMGRAASGGTPVTALRAQRGDGAEPPVEARSERNVIPEVVQEHEDEGLAPEQLELLEDEAMGGEDEGRSTTDYDRRAHIFEESSRVFRDLKHRRDGEGEGEGDGGVKVGAAAGSHG